MMVRIFLFSVLVSVSTSAFGAHYDCVLETISFERRVEFADKIIVGKVLKDEEVSPPAHWMNRKATVKIERVFKGSFKKGDTATFYYVKVKDDDCDLEALHPLAAASSTGHPILFYIKEVEGKHFISQGLGFMFAEEQGARMEIKRLSQMSFGLWRYFSWAWIKSFFE